MIFILSGAAPSVNRVGPKTDRIRYFSHWADLRDPKSTEAGLSQSSNTSILGEAFLYRRPQLTAKAERNRLSRRLFVTREGACGRHRLLLDLRSDTVVNDF